MAHFLVDVYIYANKQNYTKLSRVFQLTLPLNIEVTIPKDESARLLGQIVEKIHLTELYQSYFRVRKNKATPGHMLKILIYAYMSRIYSSRQIAQACHRNINFMYLLKDMPAPGHNVTFMRMNEDAMLNGQLKPAYNIRFGVDAEYVVWITAGPQPTDTLTLIPFLKEQEQYFQHRYQQVVADSGYESEDNYLYMEWQHQQAFIKPSNYEKGKTRNYRKDIGRRENMVYDATSDCYQCAVGKLLARGRTYHRLSRSGFLSEVTCYSCKECPGCTLKSQCIKGNNCSWRRSIGTSILMF